MSDWLTMLGTARRMMHLTQEDFAADLGISRSTLAHWENGRRPIPSAIKRRILDMMGGYYHRHPECKALLARAEASGAFITLYREGFIIQNATSYAKRTWFNSMKTEMIGQPILPLMRSSMHFLELAEKYYISMLKKKSEIISISYIDESLLFPDKLVRSVVTSCDVGEGRILCIEDCYLPENQDRGILNGRMSIINIDDV